MEQKKKKKSFRFLGWKLKEMIQFGTVIGTLIWGALYLDRKFESIDRRFEAIERRLDAIEHRLDKIEFELKKTSDLLNDYLTWRFIYVNDPTRKHLVPRYDPVTRTLEFVDTSVKVKAIKMDVRTANEYDF